MENRNYSILLIDDNPDNIVSLKAVIEDVLKDVVVFYAYDGRKGIDIAMEVYPDVILLDIVMPEMDGFEVCSMLKDDELLRDIPIVFVTALKEDRNSKFRALECGAEGFLSKPIDVSELHAQIRAMVKIKRANDEKRSEKRRLTELVNIRTKEYSDENQAKAKTEKALLEAQKLAHIGSFEFDVSSGKLECTDEVLEICGINRMDFLGHPDEIIKHINIDDKKLVLEKSSKLKDDETIKLELRLEKTDGDERIVNLRQRGVFDESGDLIRTVGTIQDITKQSAIEKALKESEERYKGLVEHSGLDISYYSPSGKVIYFNKIAASNVGGLPNNFKGVSIFDIYSKERSELYIKRIKKAISLDSSQEYEDYISDLQTPRWFLRTFSKVLDSKGNVAGVQVSSLDISMRKKAEQELRFLSYHDQLTGINNRRYFEEEIIKLDLEKNLPISLVMADVNGLKLINDSFGHVVGDDLLRMVSDVIKKHCNVDDIVARIGGDEFIIAMPRADSSKAELLVSQLEQEFSKKKIASMKVSISFGYDTKYTENQSIQDILKSAEDYLYKHKVYESSSMHSKTLDVIMNALYEKSSRELNHSKRVSNYCEAISKALNMDYDGVNRIKTAGLLHDIGKIGIDEKVLNKPGRLKDYEWLEMKKHPESSWRILISSDEFSNLAQFVLEHHERWDGKGYPNGIKGEEISLEARIISLADSYDAMTSDRTYKKAMSKIDAINEIERCKGQQFDPKIADVFINDVLVNE